MYCNSLNSDLKLVLHTSSGLLNAMSLTPSYHSCGHKPACSTGVTNPIRMQYSQKSRNNLCNLGFTSTIGGILRSRRAITGINVPKFPAEVDACKEANT